MSRSEASAQPQTAGSLSFVEFLRTRLRDEPPKQKGLRTRERLKIATAATLEAKGYHAMRVTDITDSAGLADGSFYVYFNDKKEAALTTLSEFLREFVDLFAPPEAVGAPFDSIRAANRRWFAICRANAGLMRCVYQLGDEDADFASLVQGRTHETYRRIARNLQLQCGSADGRSLLLAVYFMGSMMDEVVRKLIVFPDGHFQELLPPDCADAVVADAASLIWIRTFDPTVSPPDDLAPLAEDIAQLMWPGHRAAES